MSSTAKRLVVLAGVTAVGASAFANGPLELVLKRTSEVPGTPPMTECFPASSFDNPKIDDLGRVLFTGVMDTSGTCGTAVTGNRRAVYYGVPGNMQMLARDGGLAGYPTLPNPNNWVHNTTTNGAGLVSFPTISPAGTIMISSSLNGMGATTTNNTTFWTGPSTGLSVVVQRGFVPATAPGTVGATWNSNMNLSTSQFDVNNAGQVIFNSQLTGGDTMTTGVDQNNSGVWLGNASGLTMIMRQGMVAPGLGDPLLELGAAPNFGTRLNGSGQAIFGVKLRVGSGATPVTTADDDVLYKWDGTQLIKIARQGEQAALMPMGVFYPTTSVSPFNPVSFSPLNNAGNLLFFSNLAGAVTVGVDDAALYLTDGTTTHLVLRRGDPAPVEGSVLAGTVFQSINFGNTRLINNNSVLLTGVYNNDASLPTPIDNTNNDFMYLKRFNQPPILIVRAGDLMNLPGLPVDARWSFDSSLAGLGMNNQEMVVFASEFTGTGVTSGVDSRGVFSWTPNEGMKMIARTGTQYEDPMTMGPATQVTIDCRGNGEGGCAGFADSGWLTLRMADAFNNHAIYRIMITNDVLCDGIDFNNDGVAPDTEDLNDFISVFGGGPCSNDPNCGDIDFNNDGVAPDTEDLNDFVSVFGGGGC